MNESIGRVIQTVGRDIIEVVLGRQTENATICARKWHMSLGQSILALSQRDRVLFGFFHRIYPPVRPQK